MAVSRLGAIQTWSNPSGFPTCNYGSPGAGNNRILVVGIQVEDGGIEQLEDSYAETNRSGSWGFSDPGGNYVWQAQIFKAANTAPISKAKLNVYVQGTVPSSTMYVYLYSISGTVQNATPNALLASATGVSTTVLGTNNQGLVDFLFEGSEQYELQDGTWYAIVMAHHDSVDTSNTVRWGIDSSAPTHLGNAARAADSGGSPDTWTAESGTDKPFYIYTKTNDASISNIQYGGQAASQVINVDLGLGPDNLVMALARFNENAISGQSGGAITATLGGSNTTGVTVHAQMYQDADQGNFAESHTDYVNASTPNPFTTVDVTADDGSAVVGFSAHGDNTSATWGADLTEQSDVTTGTSGASLADGLFATGQAVQVRCTWTGQVRRGDISVEIASTGNVVQRSVSVTCSSSVSAKLTARKPRSVQTNPGASVSAKLTAIKPRSVQVNPGASVSAKLTAVKPRSVQVNSKATVSAKLVAIKQRSVLVDCVSTTLISGRDGQNVKEASVTVNCVASVQITPSKTQYCYGLGFSKVKNQNPLYLRSGG